MEDHRWVIYNLVKERINDAIRSYATAKSDCASAKINYETIKAEREKDGDMGWGSEESEKSYQLAKEYEEERYKILTDWREVMDYVVLNFLEGIRPTTNKEVKK